MYISISLQCSILVLHFEEFQSQKKLVKLHIPSKYSKEMAQKSQTVSLVYWYIHHISQHSYLLLHVHCIIGSAWLFTLQ